MQSLASQIKEEAYRLGFFACGIAKADFLENEARRLEVWLKKNANGKMQYMENHFDQRTDPRKLVEGAQTVISVLKNYYPDEIQNPEAPKISKYAYGTDYHFVVKDGLKLLLAFIEEKVGTAVNARCFVDSAPVLDKAWAKKAGLGWQGKHTNLIRRDSGSFFFIGEIILDLSLPPDAPFVSDHCGSCTRCIDACPTGALSPYQIDGSRCISYLTIELRESIPAEFHNQMDGWAFGCDVCQDVCPWNRFAKPHAEPQFQLIDFLKTAAPAEWRELTGGQYKRLTRSSPLARVSRQKMLENITIASPDKTVPTLPEKP